MRQARPTRRPTRRRRSLPSRLTSEWFALGGYRPVPRIELNYNDATKGLVAAGYGAALLPHEAGARQSDERIAMRPLRPVMWRELGIAYRFGQAERATQHVLDALWELKAHGRVAHNSAL